MYSNLKTEIPIPEVISSSIIDFAEKTYQQSSYELSSRTMWHKAAKLMGEAMYRKMQEELEMYKSCDPRWDVHEASLEKIWMKFIADWQPGQINSGLGQALQDKFNELKK